MAEITLTTLTPAATIAGYRVAASAAREALRLDQYQQFDTMNEHQWRERQRLIVLLGELEAWLGELEREHGAWLAPPTT